MKRDKLKRRVRALRDLGPCKCSMFDGPHYHVDAATIISEATMKRAVQQFNQENSRGEDVRD